MESLNRWNLYSRMNQTCGDSHSLPEILIDFLTFLNDVKREGSLSCLKMYSQVWLQLTILCELSK